MSEQKKKWAYPADHSNWRSKTEGYAVSEIHHEHALKRDLTPHAGTDRSDDDSRVILSSSRNSVSFSSRTRNETLSVVAVCISNEDRLSVGINRCDAAPTPPSFAEIVRSFY
jgi:hypothetical protein